MSAQLEANSRSLLGYELKSRIGAGGYGEVWKAEAPGGLQKAIKLIYGFHDEERAMRELKALNRVKELRHPFLLSLERIEVYEGQLIIVTELAEASLKDRYEACRSDGLPGVPRDELLRYLSDAAEALDYICDSQTLQHLDVKPENLLLIGHHVKVADFGLVKDLRDVTASLLGGLTPLYAPPELFDGRPCQFSDQYSLAIVFQEMLTGQRPFPGTTVAQLAAQHVRSRPNLSLLPTEDQAIVARALSKTPGQRFANCQELVNALLRSDRPILTTSGSVHTDTVQSTTGAATERLAFVPRASDSAAQVADSHPPLQRSAPEVTDLPALDWDAGQSLFRPTLLVGLGQTASRILQQLRRKLVQRVALPTDLPSLGLLCIDTDERTLAEVSRGDAVDGIQYRETIAIPLRSAEQYRDDSQRHLNWISRRWLYNIPRSKQTEGIRPLGRLALVDHAAALRGRLQQAIQQVVNAESIATTLKTLSDPLQPRSPRVIVLASIGGGVGSGAVLDLGYLIQDVLTQLNLADDGLCGVLLHSTDRQGDHQSLTVANSYACVKEMRHFAKMGFPGDSSLNLPASDRPPFANTYLVNLGENLLQEEYEAATDAVAEYLFLSAATPTAGLLDTCRDASASGKESSLHSVDPMSQIQTFGLSRVGDVSQQQIEEVSLRLCHQLINHWLGEGTTLDSSTWVANLFAEHQLEVQALLENLEQLFQEELGPEPIAALKALVRTEERSHDAPAATAGNGPRERCLRHVDAMLGLVVALPGGDEATASALSKRLARRTRQRAQQLSEAVLKSIHELVDRPDARLRGARGCEADLAQRLIACDRELTQRVDHFDQQSARLAASPIQPDGASRGRASRASDSAPPSFTSHDAWLSAFLEIRWQGQLAQHARDIIRRLMAAISKHQRVFLDLNRELVQQRDQFAAGWAELRNASKRSDDDDRDHPSLQERLYGLLLEQIPQQIDKLDQRMQAEFAQYGGLRAALMDHAETLRKLSDRLKHGANEIVCVAMRAIDITHLLMAESEEDSEVCFLLKSHLDDAAPRWKRCGGIQRLIVSAPTSPELAAFQELLKGPLKTQPTLAGNRGGGVTVCYEMELPLGNIALHLLDNNPEIADYVNRLHTRTDVEWSALTDIV